MLDRGGGDPRVQWVGPKERCTPRKHYTEETETLHSSFLPLTQTMSWCVDRFQNGPGDGEPEVGVGRKHLGLGPLGLDECPQGRSNVRACPGLPVVSWYPGHSIHHSSLGEFLALWLLP